MRNDHEIRRAAERALQELGWDIVSKRSIIGHEAGFVAMRRDELLVGEAMAHFASRRVERPYRKPYVGHEPWHELSQAVFRVIASAGCEDARGCLVIPDDPLTVDWANLAVAGLRRADIHLVVVDAEHATDVVVPQALR